MGSEFYERVLARMPFEISLTILFLFLLTSVILSEVNSMNAVEGSGSIK